MPMQTRSRSASGDGSTSQDTTVVGITPPSTSAPTTATTTTTTTYTKGGAYSLIQEQLRELDQFTGDPAKISWANFEYRFTSALDVAPDLPEKMKLSLLKQKLGGAPAELLRLEPELRNQSFDELLSWLGLRYQEIHAPRDEMRKWQAGDTPDSYLVRIKRSAEADLPPLPARKIPQRDDKDRLVRDSDGNLIIIDNPKYLTEFKERQEYMKKMEIRLRRDYIDGLKPSLQRKLVDPPKTLEDLHSLVRRMYIHELKHPSTAEETAPTKSTGLPVFSTQAEEQAQVSQHVDGKDKNNVDLRKVFHGMKDVTQTLAKAMVKMTEQGAVKPTARAGTARDPAEPKRCCFECESPGHLARDCPIRQAKAIVSKANKDATGQQRGPGPRNNNGGRGRGNQRGGQRSYPYNPRQQPPYPQQQPPAPLMPTYGYPSYGYPTPAYPSSAGYMYPAPAGAAAGAAPGGRPQFKSDNGRGKGRGGFRGGNRGGDRGRPQGNGGRWNGNKNNGHGGRKPEATVAQKDDRQKPKPAGADTERRQEIMANVASVLEQLHGEWAEETSKN